MTVQASTPPTTVDDLMEQLCGDDLVGRFAKEHLQSGGRRTRARLAMVAGTALGISDIRPWAAACELLHNATLVHDDLQDGDRVRRGKPTTWALHGAAQAINTGDLMLMLPMMAVLRQRATAEQRNALTGALVSRAVACVRGQADELALTKAPQWTIDAWEVAALGKSGQLLALPVEGAAILANLDGTDVGDRFARAGVLYQLVDDLVDLYGNKGRARRGNDIAEGKVSALVVHHLNLEPDHSGWLRQVLGTPRDQTTDRDIARCARAFRASGAVDAVRASIDTQLNELLSPDLHPSLQPVAATLASRCTQDLETLA